VQCPRVGAQSSKIRCRGLRSSGGQRAGDCALCRRLHRGPKCKLIDRRMALGIALRYCQCQVLPAVWEGLSGGAYRAYFRRKYRIRERCTESPAVPPNVRLRSSCTLSSCSIRRVRHNDKKSVPAFEARATPSVLLLTPRLRRRCSSVRVSRPSMANPGMYGWPLHSTREFRVSVLRPFSESPVGVSTQVLDPILEVFPGNDKQEKYLIDYLHDLRECVL
jgi:hypothetical protein